MGHLSRNCPVPGRAVSVESHGEGSKGNETKKMATIVPERMLKEKQDKVAELHQALKQAEIEETLDEAGTTMYVLSPDEGNEKVAVTLGPTLTSEVLVDRKETKALLDTLSPVNILSLNFIVNHWAQQRKEGQTVEQWKEEVRNRLRSPSLTLKNYGGNEINILKETSVKLERGGYSCTEVVLLQKNPPHDLLIGTDLLPSLGFQFIQRSASTKVGLDLFNQNKRNVRDSKGRVENPVDQGNIKRNSSCITARSYFMKS